MSSEGQVIRWRYLQGPEFKQLELNKSTQIGALCNMFNIPTIIVQKHLHNNNNCLLKSYIVNFSSIVKLAMLLL